MFVYFDYRETDLKSEFEKVNKDFDTATRNLPVGDVWIATSEIGQNCVVHGDSLVYIIERKTYADLYSSICDNRYHSQLDRMLERLSPEKIVYILEKQNFSRDVRKRKIVTGAQVSIVFKHACKVVYSMSVENTAELVLGICRTVSHAPTGDKSPTVFSKRSDSVSVYLSQLVAIPGIGMNTALAIEKEFPSMAELVSALNSDGQTRFSLIQVNKRKIGDIRTEIVCKSLGVNPV